MEGRLGPRRNELLADLIAFVATVLLLLVIPRALDALDALREWWGWRNAARP